MNFDNITAVISDMDGVLCRGSEKLPGMNRFFDLLREADLPFILLTNNSSRQPTEYVKKLADMGVSDISPDNIVTSTVATIQFLKREYPNGADVHVLGAPALHEMIADAGFNLVEMDSQVTVVAIDRDLTYEKLKVASFNVQNGARFIGTNHDTSFPSPEGLAPGSGSIITAVAVASGVEPQYMGKPHAPMFQIALDRIGADPATTLMIGDRLDTDISGAQHLGMQTALVLSGVTTPDGLVDSDVQPTVAYESMDALVTAWDYQGGKRRR